MLEQLPWQATTPRNWIRVEAVASGGSVILVNNQHRGGNVLFTGSDEACEAMLDVLDSMIASVQYDLHEQLHKPAFAPPERGTVSDSPVPRSPGRKYL